MLRLQIPGQMAVAPNNKAEKTRVFISYSRKDFLFVDALRAGLDSRAFDVVVDRKDIEKGEAFWLSIQQLIASSDAVVFVVSPDSVSSSVCKDEANLSVRLGKRLIPVIWRPTGDPLPGDLSRYNYP